jgi:hypothetical protein
MFIYILQTLQIIYKPKATNALMQLCSYLTHRWGSTRSRQIICAVELVVAANILGGVVTNSATSKIRSMFLESAQNPTRVTKWARIDRRIITGWAKVDIVTAILSSLARVVSARRRGAGRA